VKPQEAIRELAKYVQTGRNLSSRWKILVICLLTYLQRRGPAAMKRHVDIFLHGILIETDVKFFIRTPNDFFIFSSIWEQELQNAFAFRKGMNFLDIGAHIGKYSVRAALKIGEDGRVIAVEPDRENFSLLLRNLDVNGITNCIPLNMAAYYKDAEISLFIGTTPAQHSVMEDFGRGSHRVQARVLDNVLAERGIERVDLIKLDVEGAEYHALKGLENTLINNDPVLIIEVMKRDEIKIIEYLESLGYTGRLLHVFLPFRGGLMFYQFKKEHLRRVSVT
jgi:FkbM family methyltransferase